MTTKQELIDNYSIAEEQVKTCEHNADKKIAKLEKALKLACVILTNLSGDCWYCPLNADRENKCLCENCVCTKEQWKEYLLKESEKQ